jgi:hypothetical protein
MVLGFDVVFAPSGPMQTQMLQNCILQFTRTNSACPGRLQKQHALQTREHAVNIRQRVFVLAGAHNLLQIRVQDGGELHKLSSSARERSFFDVILDSRIGKDVVDSIGSIREVE